MKKNAFFLLSLISFLGSSQNLVPNGSFETFSSCPPTSVACVGRIDLLSSWFIPTDGNSPDLFTTCHTAPFPGLDVGVPSNMYGTQSARTGNSYAGLYPLTEYIEIQLTAPLVAGNSYDFSMYVNQADFAQNCTDGLGVYFSNNVTTAAAGWNNAQVNNVTFNFITNTVGWAQVSGTYIAAGGENYITIGNFFSSFYPVSNPGGSLSNSYYYIDDVSLIDLTPLPIELLSFEANEKNGEGILTWSTKSEINNAFFTVEKSVNGIDFEVLTTLPGAGNSSIELNYTTEDHGLEKGITYYRLKQTDFDGKSSVSVIKSLSIIEGSSLINRIYPNPSKGQFNISLNQLATLAVYDVSGRLVYAKTATELISSININQLENGIYFLVISNDKMVETSKLIKEK